MEDTSAIPHDSRTSPAPGESDVPRDLREWLDRAEKIGQIKRITQPVDHNEEMGAITYMAHQEIGAPALLFESIKGCPKGFRALEPTGLTVMELIRRCKAKFTRSLAPVTIDASQAPVNASSTMPSARCSPAR